MFKALAIALIFCLGVVGQIEAQCSGSYSSYYHPGIGSSGSCNTYYSSPYNYRSTVHYGGFTNLSRYQPAKLPTPPYAKQNTLKETATKSTVSKSNTPIATRITPVQSPIRYRSSFLNYVQPSCATGNCPYR